MPDGFKRLNVICTHNSAHSATGHTQRDHSPVVRMVRKEQSRDLRSATSKERTCKQRVPAVIATAHQ
jgi:hypothetical protein